jgi:hypothetical protein
MLFVKKLQLSKQELKQLRRETEGYAWVAMDIKNHMIVAGSEHYSALKRKLYDNRSRAHDIWGVGLDMRTGDIDYVSPINRKLQGWRSVLVPRELIERINKEIYYFFDNLAAVRRQKI